MNPINVALWVIGLALIAIGYMRFRGPWARYRGLREQQGNIDRYEAWRGGVRAQDDGPTGASFVDFGNKPATLTCLVQSTE